MRDRPMEKRQGTDLTPSLFPIGVASIHQGQFDPEVVARCDLHGHGDTDRLPVRGEDRIYGCFMQSEAKFCRF